MSDSQFDTGTDDWDDWSETTRKVEQGMKELCEWVQHELISGIRGADGEKKILEWLDDGSLGEEKTMRRLFGTPEILPNVSYGGLRCNTAALLLLNWYSNCESESSVSPFSQEGNEFDLKLKQCALHALSIWRNCLSSSKDPEYVVTGLIDLAENWGMGFIELLKMYDDPDFPPGARMKLLNALSTLQTDDSALDIWHHILLPENVREASEAWLSIHENREEPAYSMVPVFGQDAPTLDAKRPPFDPRREKVLEVQVAFRACLFRLCACVQKRKRQNKPFSRAMARQAAQETGAFVARFFRRRAESAYLAYQLPGIFGRSPFGSKQLSGSDDWGIFKDYFYSYLLAYAKDHRFTSFSRDMLKKHEKYEIFPSSSHW